MNFKSITQRIQALGFGYLLPGVFFLLAVLLFVLVALPQFYKINQIRNDKKSLNEELEGLRKRVAVLADYGTQKNLIRDYEELLRTAIPMDKEVPMYMTQVEKMAQDVGLAVEAVSFGVSSSAASTGESSAAVPADAQELVVNATFTGPLENGLQFLKTCESSLRIVTVRSLRGTYEEATETEAGDYTHTYGLVTYYMPRVSQDATASSAEDLQSPVVQNVIKQLRSMKMYSAGAEEQEPRSIITEPEAGEEAATPSAEEEPVPSPIP